MLSRQLLTRRSRRGETETAAVLDGTIAGSPLTIMVHIRGDAAPFPSTWKWGKVVLNGQRPEWQRLRLFGNKERILIPEDARPIETPRQILRTELSAFCPNPRKSIIIPMVAGTTRFLLGVPRRNLETVIAALDKTRRLPSSG